MAETNGYAGLCEVCGHAIERGNVGADIYFKITPRTGRYFSVGGRICSSCCDRAGAGAQGMHALMRTACRSLIPDEK